MKKRLVCSIFALLALLALQLAAAPAAQAHAFGDPHNCEALAKGATYGPGNLTPSPFDAYQIPNSPAFSWGSNYLVACQEREIYPSDPQPGFNNANWDGYGNPFQCVELIDRYTHLRYGDSYSWGDAGSDWTNHPWYYVQRTNNDVYAPVVGDILIWNDSSPGHIAIIIGVNAAIHKVTILEQNFHYWQGSTGKWVDSAKRVLYYDYYRPDPSAYISGSGYTAYRQDGSTFSGNEADPVGWLHATI